MSSKKGLGRGLGAIVSLAPVQADGAARIDEAIRASAGPSVLALSGDSFDEIVRAGASGKPLAPPSSRRDAQPMCPPPGSGFAPPLDLRVGATGAPRGPEPAPVSVDSAPRRDPAAEVVVASGSGVAVDPVVALLAADPPEGPIVPIDGADIAVAAPAQEEAAAACAAVGPCAAAAAVDSDAMAAARRAVQYSLFEAPVSPSAPVAPPSPPAPEVVAETVPERVGAVPVSIAASLETAPCAAPVAPVAVEEPGPPVLSSAPPEAPVVVAVPVPPAPVAAPADAAPEFTDDVLYFDDTVLVDDTADSPVAPALPAPPAPAASPAPVAPPPATFSDDAVLIDDVFIDDVVGGFVLPDVEME